MRHDHHPSRSEPHCHHPTLIAFTLQLAPEFADARLLAGNIFVRAHLPENAIVEYEEYLRLDPKGQFAPEIRQLVQTLKSMVAKKK